MTFKLRSFDATSLTPRGGNCRSILPRARPRRGCFRRRSHHFRFRRPLWPAPQHLLSACLRGIRRPPSQIPRRRQSHPAAGVCAHRRLAPCPSPRWVLGKASTRGRARKPCPWSSSASPLLSGPEAENPATPPLPRSSSSPRTASWFAPRDSINGRYVRTAAFSS